MSQSTVRRRLVLTLAAPLVAVVLAGCATTGSAPATQGGEQGALMKRAQAYWALVRDKDAVAAWAYEAASKIHFAGAHYRRDIAHRAFNR